MLRTQETTVDAEDGTKEGHVLVVVPAHCTISLAHTLVPCRVSLLLLDNALESRIQGLPLLVTV